MKNFDEKRAQRQAIDRHFQIGGEQYVARVSVRPEKLSPYEQLKESDDITETLKIIDELIIAFIETGNDAHARYRAMREREEDAVGVEDLQDLVEWLMEIHTGRPTVPPGGSTESPGTTGTASTDDSSSPDTPTEPTV